jgi:branched-subunit amino acid ABC-type transport system permease component
VGILAAGLAYKACVGFLAGLALALLFRVARCLDISGPTVALFALYATAVWDCPSSLVAVGITVVSSLLWFSLFRRIKDQSAATLVLSIGIQTMVYSATTIAFADRSISLADARHQLVGGWAIAAVAALFSVAIVLHFALRLRFATRNIRATADDPLLAAAIGADVEVVQWLAFVTAGLLFWAAAALWASQTEIRTSQAVTLILYGIAVGGWGRSLQVGRLALVSLTLATLSTALAYAGGPLLADIGYVLTAIFAVLARGALQTRDEE